MDNLLKQAISHQPGTSQAYTRSRDSVELRIRTGLDVSAVSIVFGDKYNWTKSRQELPLQVLGRDNLFFFWRIIIFCPVKRLRYCFRLSTDVHTTWFAEDGFHEEQKDEPQGFFDFPRLHLQDSLEIPAWVRDAIFYQIFPDRFALGSKAINAAILTPWDAKPASHSIYGGDLEGIIQNIEYLCDLGINAIYLTPIFAAPSNHKYDTVDYFSIDPHFGELQTLKRLVSLCHERGIRVVLDAVFNHIGWQSPQFQDVLQRGAASPYANWFHVNDFPICMHPRPSYDTFAFVAEMPKLNTKDYEVREYLLRVATYWIEHADIDGWRLDVANEVDHEFWREFRKRVLSVKPQAYILGEIMHQAESWLQGDQFDGVMNYPLTAALIAWLTGKGDALTFVHRLAQLQFAYSRPALEGCLNLLDSHDTPRLLSQLGGNRGLFKLAVTALLTLPGAPSIYYGDEIGMEGGPDPDCRRGMVWDSTRQDLQLRNWYKKLISLRHAYRALRRGDLEVLPMQKNVAAWWRRDETGEELLIVLNSSVALAVRLDILPEGRWIDLLSDELYQNSDAVQPLRALILRRYETACTTTLLTTFVPQKNDGTPSDKDCAPEY